MSKGKKIPILKSPAVALTQVSEPVNHYERDDYRMYVDKIKQAYHNAGFTMQGLSLPQIGINKRVILVRIKGEPVVMCNPSVIWHFGKKMSNEGCESVTGRFNVRRHRIAYVCWNDWNGRFCKKLFFYKTLRIIEHEIDHLNGILISKKGIKANV
jgi:peptide deformylase